MVVVIQHSGSQSSSGWYTTYLLYGNYWKSGGGHPGSLTGYLTAEILILQVFYQEDMDPSAMEIK